MRHAKPRSPRKTFFAALIPCLPRLSSFKSHKVASNVFPFLPPIRISWQICHSQISSMGEPRSCRLWLLVLVFARWYHASIAMTFTISNYCPHPIWPGTLAGAGTPQLSTTGFKLDPGQAVQLAAPAGWSGRIWARTGCVFDADGAGVCQTGDCGGRMECRGAGATPPATLFEVTLDGSGGLDFYDVSLVDGYNLPVVAIPRSRQGGACNATGCMADLNRCKCQPLLRLLFALLGLRIAAGDRPLTISMASAHAAADGSATSVPEGAAGGLRRRRHRVPERVRGVRAGQVLLQRPVRDAGRVPPDGVLLHLQVGVPARLQLRLRRPHQHLHLQGLRLHHRLLPPDLRVITN